MAKDQNKGEQRKEARKTNQPNTQTQDKKYLDALKSEVFGSDQKDYQKDASMEFSKSFLGLAKNCLLPCCGKDTIKKTVRASNSIAGDDL